MTPYEQWVLETYANVVVRSRENTHFQHSLGILPDEHVAAARRQILVGWSSKTLRDIWRGNRHSYGEYFVLWMNDIMDEIEQGKTA